MKSFRSGGRRPLEPPTFPSRCGTATRGQTREAQLRYMEIDLAHALNVSAIVTGGTDPQVVTPVFDGESSDDDDDGMVVSE